MLVGSYANGLGTRDLNIIGDGEGGKVRVDVEGGKITNTVVVTSGGKRLQLCTCRSWDQSIQTPLLPLHI